MFTIKKRMEIAGAHRLSLPYESKCSHLHGHNWIITVTCQSNELNEAGMVIDFQHIKEIVGQIDHRNLNEVLGDGVNPTAEYIAYWLCKQIPHCVRVEVQESEGNVAIYEP